MVTNSNLGNEFPFWYRVLICFLMFLYFHALVSTQVICNTVVSLFVNEGPPTGWCDSIIINVSIITKVYLKRMGHFVRGEIFFGRLESKAFRRVLDIFCSTQPQRGHWFGTGSIYHIIQVYLMIAVAMKQVPKNIGRCVTLSTANQCTTTENWQSLWCQLCRLLSHHRLSQR